MATASDYRPAQSDARPVSVEMKVTAYDKVASWLTAFLVVVGAGVLALLVIWLTRRISFTHVTVPVEAVQFT